MTNIQTKLDYADAIADCFLEIGEAHCLSGELEVGLKYTYIAAKILSRQNRSLSSPRLESNLLFAARRLTEDGGPRRLTARTTGQKVLCLHVLSEALPAGGLTAMATRWMRNDQSGRIHSVALLSTEVPIPDELRKAVTDSGGSIHTKPADTILHQADWLRGLSELATYVVLHVDVSDVICGIAFGTKGGPPVLLVNHTAHSFWTGGSIADLVVNVRGSALEETWTAKHRGVLRYATVPIPLLEPKIVTPGRSSGQAKRSIGIPPGAVVILTVGASFKYLATEDLDFVEAFETILKELPDAYLIAVGFDGDSRWRNASRRLGSRIRTLGTVSQSQLSVIHEAADVYVEGFPFGTTTALLEAGLKGIPVVLAPAQCPPPYGSDGVALDGHLERPCDLEEYKSKIIQLGKNPVERALYGEAIRNAVSQHHTGSGWRQYLEHAISTMPHDHMTYPPTIPARTPQAIHEYWCAFVAKRTSRYEETLEHAFVRALSIGLRPRLSDAMRRVCRQYGSVRANRTMPLPLLAFFFNFLLPFLPMALALTTFRACSFLFRGSLLPRLRMRLLRLLGGSGVVGEYEEYRHVRDTLPLSREAMCRVLDDRNRV